MAYEPKKKTEERRILRYLWQFLDDLGGAYAYALSSVLICYCKF